MRFVFISEFLGHNSGFSFLAPKTYFCFITQVYKFGSEVPAVSWEFSWGIQIMPLYFSNVICREHICSKTEGCWIRISILQHNCTSSNDLLASANETSGAKISKTWQPKNSLGCIIFICPVFENVHNKTTTAIFLVSLIKARDLKCSSPGLLLNSRKNWHLQSFCCICWQIVQFSSVYFFCHLYNIS